MQHNVNSVSSIPAEWQNRQNFESCREKQTPPIADTKLVEINSPANKKSWTIEMQRKLLILGIVFTFE